MSDALSFLMTGEREHRAFTSFFANEHGGAHTPRVSDEKKRFAHFCDRPLCGRSGVGCKKITRAPSKSTDSGRRTGVKWQWRQQKEETSTRGMRMRAKATNLSLCVMNVSMLTKAAASWVMKKASGTMAAKRQNVRDAHCRPLIWN